MNEFFQRNAKWIIAIALVLVVIGLVLITSCRAPAMMVRIPAPPSVAATPTVRETYVEKAIITPVVIPPPAREYIVHINYPSNIPPSYYFWCVERSTNKWQWAFDQWCNPDSNGTQVVTQRAKVEFFRIAGIDPCFVTVPFP